MMTDLPSSQGKKQELKALALMASEAEIVHRLKEIVGAYGKVVRVLPLGITMPGYEDHRVFIVDFARTEDAMFASLDLDCVRYSFLTLMVMLPRRVSDDALGHDTRRQAMSPSTRMNSMNMQG